MQETYLDTTWARTIPVQLITLALSRLPIPVQMVLATHEQREVREALASSPYTDITVIDELVKDKSIPVSRIALKRTTDAGRVAKALTRVVVAERAATNPLAARETLVSLLHSKHTTSDHTDIALQAYCNPNTPLTERTKLSGAWAEKMISAGTKKAGHTVRAHELVIANPWMAEYPSTWCKQIQEAIAGLPQTKRETLDVIYDRDEARRSVFTHPTYRGDINSLDIDELIKANSPAADLHAIGKPEFTQKHAETILQRTKTGRVYPHIVGRLANKYGATILYPADGWVITRPNILEARWVAPIMGYLYNTTKNERQDAVETARILNTDPQRWNELMNILPDWHGTLKEAVEAINKL